MAFCTSGGTATLQTTGQHQAAPDRQPPSCGKSSGLFCFGNGPKTLPHVHCWQLARASWFKAGKSFQKAGSVETAEPFLLGWLKALC